VTVASGLEKATKQSKRNIQKGGSKMHIEHRRNWAVGVTVLVMVIMLAGCSQKRASQPPMPETEIKIGAIFPMTGAIARFGEYKKRGVELAVADINAKGGINGRKLVVIYEDSQNDPKVGVSAFQKLVWVDKVKIIISAMSQVSMALVPLADQHKVVLFANVGHPEITKKSQWVFRNFPTSDREADTMAKFAIDKLKVKRAAILYLNDEWGVAGRDAFKRSFEARGGKVVIMEGYARGTVDFRTQLTKIKGMNPDAIYFTGYGNALGLICKQRKELGLKAVMLTTTGFNDAETFRAAGDAREGVYFTSLPFDPQKPSGKAKSYVEKFKKKYGIDPEFDGALHYDTVMLIAAAIRARGYDAEGVRQWLSQVNRFEGVCGNLMVSPTRDFYTPLVVRMIRGLKVVTADQ
jgi:branched-chain amino acid transport system substrate-binding protein